LHGMPEAVVAPTSTSDTAQNEPSEDSGPDWTLGSKNQQGQDEDGWQDTTLLSDPAQIHHPTEIAEHPNGGLEVVVHGNEDITVMGTIEPNGDVRVHDIMSDRNHSQPTQAAEAVRTFLREAARRSALSVTGNIENMGVAHGVIRNCGTENVMLNGRPTTPSELKDAVRAGGANVSIYLHDRKVKKFLERPHYR